MADPSVIAEQEAQAIVALLQLADIPSRWDVERADELNGHIGRFLRLRGLYPAAFPKALMESALRETDRLAETGAKIKRLSRTDIDAAFMLPLGIGE